MSRMPWDRGRWADEVRCIVCGIRTRDMVAPLGIVSGSYPCHVNHGDKEILDAWLALAEKFASREDIEGDVHN